MLSPAFRRVRLDIGGIDNQFHAKAFRPTLTPPSKRPFDLLVLIEITAIAWLWFGFARVFADLQLSWLRDGMFVLVAAILLASLSYLKIISLGKFSPAFRSALSAVAIALPGIIAGKLGWIQITSAEAVWLGVWLGIISFVVRRLAHRTAASRQELIRWILVPSAGALAMLPFLYGGSVGAGDSHWYVLMLSDFITQIRAGVFPVWIGQSLYAFNGAVMPVRFAPGFQYAGAVVDLATVHALDPTQIKNVTLVSFSIFGAVSAYSCLRLTANTKPWVACSLSILWVFCPGVLAPVMAGDQYMTFMTLPFLPITLYGCWRSWNRDDYVGPLLVATSLAGLWFCHSPIGMWMTFIVLGSSLPAFLRRTRYGIRRVAVPIAAFLVFGSFPFVSVLSLKNQAQAQIAGASAAVEVWRPFPGNFQPLQLNLIGASSYQLGYSLDALLLLSVFVAFRQRRHATLPLALSCVAVIPLTVPIPWLTNLLWRHMPRLVVTIDNVWPTQRLFLVLSILVVFLAAAAFGTTSFVWSRKTRGIGSCLLVAGIIWSAREAWTMERYANRTKVSPAQTKIYDGTDNAQLGRTPYCAFEFAPAYASHGFMDAWFENRLLDRSTQTAIISNADAAAPNPTFKVNGSAWNRLVSSGTLEAENIPNSDYYELVPRLKLNPKENYALRLEFLDPEVTGTLEILHQDMFREYLLPDSGIGIGSNPPSLAFGSQSHSSHVLSLTVGGDKEAAPEGLLITKKTTRTNFAAAHFWLYAYDRNTLPIKIISWIPYRAEVDAPRDAFLETPRLWVNGWHAQVNGHDVEVKRSKQNLAMIPVKSGQNQVVLSFVPTWPLALSLWCTVAAWALTLGLGAYWLWGGFPSDPQGQRQNRPSG